MGLRPKVGVGGLELGISSAELTPREKGVEEREADWEDRGRRKKGVPQLAVAGDTLVRSLGWFPCLRK